MPEFDVLAPPRASRRDPSRPTCRIVVPLGPEAARELAVAARAHGLSIRTIVIRALYAAGVAVSPRHLEQRGIASGAGRRRVKTAGYAVSVVLPASVFRAMHRHAAVHGWTVAHLVRQGLARAGFTLGDGELVIDRRRKGARTPRRHYACADRG